MGASLERVSSSAPCRICNHTDWCFRLRYDDGTTTHQCYRDKGLVQCDTTGADGRFYKFKTVHNGDLGMYGKYQESAEYEFYKKKWCEEHGYAFKQNTPQSYVPKKAEKIVKENISEAASPKRLDAVYRYFLSLLVLEDWHMEILKEEWNKGIEPNLCRMMLTTYPIRTVPPEDKVRFNLVNQKFKNMTRKQIMQKMVDKFESLEGIPGFYQRSYDKAWTFVSLCGICYPIYNTYGQIIRIRIADDYPSVAAPDGSGVYLFSNKTAEWFLKPNEAMKENVVVESQAQNIHRVKLSKKGYPQGKVSGKYKNFSSYSELKKKIGEDVIISNRYLNGTQSGSYCSLYYKEGDSFETVYITEGEKKAEVVNLLFHAPVGSLPGVGTFGKLLEKQDGYDESIIEFIIRKGCKNLVLAYDADKNSNLQVLKSEKNAVLTLMKTGLNLYISEWRQQFGKGLDDIAIIGIRPTYHLVTK